MKAIIHFIKKEFLQFKRDPKMFAIVLVAPIFQLIVLGLAVNFDVEVVHTAVFDQDKTETSRDYIDRFRGSGYFQFDYYVNNYNEMQNLIDKGEIILGLVIPKDFEKNIGRNQTAKVQAIFDGSDGNTANISAGYVQSITFNYSKKLLVDIQNRSGIKLEPAGITQSESRVWYNPELKTRVFMVPGIVGLLLMIVTIVLTSLAIVKEKEIGTMEQLIVTPLKPYQIIIGKLVPFIIIGLIVEILVLNAMHFSFGIEIRGSTLLLYFVTLIYVLSTLGLGLFVSTVSKTQQQAMMLAIFTIMMPMVFLSGFTFPIENMPKAIQYITYIVPLRYFMTIIRGIILKGIGIAELWPETLVLFLMGVGILAISSLRFNKRLD